MEKYNKDKMKQGMKKSKNKRLKFLNYQRQKPEEKTRSVSKGPSDWNADLQLESFKCDIIPQKMTLNYQDGHFI